MRAKTKTGGRQLGPVRYSPADPAAYPVQVQEGGYLFWRIWCRPNAIVYEKWKNGVQLGFLVLPTEKELFDFNSMVNYVENFKGTNTLCNPGV